LTEKKQQSGAKQSIDAIDFLAIFGIGLQAYGFWLVFQPLAFIIPGIELLVIAVFSARGPAK